MTKIHSYEAIQQKLAFINMINDQDEIYNFLGTGKDAQDLFFIEIKYNKYAEKFYLKATECLLSVGDVIEFNDPNENWGEFVVTSIERDHYEIKGFSGKRILFQDEYIRFWTKK